LRIYITGASCAGVTTLGASLAATLDVQHVDVDDFYWLPTNPPFTTKRSPAERVEQIQRVLDNRGWVLTGSFDGWGDALVEAVDVIVFIDTPTPLRLERLVARETERFGARILPGGDMFEIHSNFREWALQYDNPRFNGRNRSRHQGWLAMQRAPVVCLEGAATVEVLAAQVIARLPER